MKIIPHKVGEKHPYDFGTAKQHIYTWIHFPVDSDERISEVWIRRYGVKLPRDRPSPVATLIVSGRPDYVDFLLTISSSFERVRAAFSPLALS